jgi:hypothetical protein
MRHFILVAAMAAVGCGRGEVRPCERIDRLCGAGFDSTDLKECNEQLPGVIDDKNWGAYKDCTGKAESCLEILACTRDSLDARGQALLDKLARGGSHAHRGDDDALPPECARANAVCADDEPFARSKCAEMVGNLKADAENKKKLTDCYAAAKNCFAFQKCTDQMWFDLH